MQLYGFSTPRSRDSANTAANGKNDLSLLYWQSVQGKQYKISNPAFMGTDLGNDVIGRGWDPTFNLRSRSFCADGRTKKDKMAGTRSPLGRDFTGITPIDQDIALYL